MNKRKSILVGLAILLLSGAVLADETLKQKVIWAPETLNLPSLKPGESTTTSAVLMNASVLSNQKIEGEHLAFQITNGAGTTITATADFPKKIAPGQKVTVRLIVSVASSTLALPPRVVSGKVYLVKKEDGDGNKKGKEEVKLFEKPLVVNITISSIPLPPLPDVKINNSTVLGIDSDANGVRDDIDWYIATTMPDSEKARMGLTQYSKEDQKFIADFLANSNDPVEQKRITRANDIERGKASECSLYTLGYIHRTTKYDFNPDGTIVGDLGRKTVEALNKAIVERKKLKTQFLNTTERQVVFSNADALLGGTGGGDMGDDRTLCQGFGFDPDLLPN